MRNQRILPARQLRLLVPDSQVIWPEAIWDSLPEDVRRDVLGHLARLLNRWFESRRSWS